MADLYGFDYGGRNIPLLLPPEFAQERGLNPYAPGMPDQRLAMGGEAMAAQAMLGQQGNGPPPPAPSVPDVPPNMGGGGAPGFVPSGGGAAGVNMGGTMGSAGSERQEARAATSTEKKDEKDAPAKGRAPLKTTEIEVPDEYAGPRQRAPQPRVMRIKGGDVRASFQVKPGQPLPEGYDEEQRLAEIKSDRALINAGLMQVEDNEALRNAQELQLLQQRGLLLEERANRSRQDDEIFKRRAAVVSREREAAELGRDPKGATEFWKEKGPVAQLVSIASIALGEYARNLNGGGGENVGLRMQEKMVNDWVQQQREKYENAQTEADVARNAYAEAIEQWGTPEAAEMDLKNRGNAIADAMLLNQARRSGDRQLLAGVEAELARRQEIRNQNRLQLQDRVSADVVENWQHVPDQYVQTGGGQKPKDIDRMVRLPNGQYAWARTEGQAKEAQGKIESNSAVAEATSRIENIRQTPESRMPLSEKRAQIETAAGDLFLAIKDGANLGTLDKGALDFRKEYIGNPEALLSPGADAKLRELGRGATKKVQDTVKYYLHSDPDAIDPVSGARPPSARSDE